MWGSLIGRCGYWLGVCVFWPSFAHAQPGSLVQWEAPAGCVDPASFRARAAQLMGAGDRSNVHFQFRVRELAVDLWELEMREGDMPLRTLRGRSCEELEQTALLMVRLSLSAEAGVEPETPAVPEASATPARPAEEATTSGTQPVAPAPVSTNRAADIARRRAEVQQAELELVEKAGEAQRERVRQRKRNKRALKRRRWSAAPPVVALLDLSAGIGVGLLPQVYPEFQFGVGLRVRHLSLALTGQARPFSRNANDVDDAWRGQYQVWSGGLRLCWRPSLPGRRSVMRRLELPVCAGVEAGVLRVGLATAERRTGDEPQLWLNAPLSIGLIVPIRPRFAWRIAVAGNFLLALPQVHIVGRPDDLLCCSVFGASFDTGFEWRFGGSRTHRRDQRIAPTSRATFSTFAGHQRGVHR